MPLQYFIPNFEAQLLELRKENPEIVHLMHCIPQDGLLRKPYHSTDDELGENEYVGLLPVPQGMFECFYKKNQR